MILSVCAILPALSSTNCKEGYVKKLKIDYFIKKKVCLTILFLTASIWNKKVGYHMSCKSFKKTKMVSKHQINFEEHTN